MPGLKIRLGERQRASAVEMLHYLKLSVANAKDKSASAAMNSYNKGGTQKLVGRNRLIVSNMWDLPIEVKACRAVCDACWLHRVGCS